MDIHARIQQFLQQQTIHAIGRGGYSEAFTKAGVVPFMRGPYRYYLMKPVAKNLERGLPEFQICKGTRENQETPTQTALREGVEELGLKIQNIKQLFDVGLYGFSSATTGKSKEMWLFAAEMKSEDFSDEVESTTAERGWFSLQEFEVVGREDHRYILRDIENKLKE